MRISLGTSQFSVREGGKEKESEEPSRADKTGDTGRLFNENDFADAG